jgi:murein DD-endopeptidase MepM/ murein hydrolase activator NlpD
MVGSGGTGRTGYSGGLFQSEEIIRAKKGEYVMQNKAVDRFGSDFMDNINSGNIPAVGGAGPMGLSGIMGAIMAGAMQAVIQKGIQTGANQANAFYGVSGVAGKYGNISLDSDQIANASKIIGVGKSMGASNRDLIISIMTAMQESGLRNLDHGDRDSIGLFQQRPSQGWGSVEEIMDPAYSARKFFDHLLALKGRNKLSMASAAQAVQRSAYPDAYKKWQSMATQVVDGMVFTPTMFNGTGIQRPVGSGAVTRTWSQHPVPKGTDIGVPVGTAVRAASAGQVVTSADLKGNQNGGYRSYGRYVVINHGNGRKTLYAHMSKRGVSAGQLVKAGQNIGYSGNTGNSTGPHLHFETWMNGADVKPSTFGVPGLSVGGKVRYDNTIANLHKNETVLTAPLSAKLEQGINKIDSGGSNNYTFNINADSINTDIDFEKVVTRVLEKKESKNGRSRVVK